MEQDGENGKGSRTQDMSKALRIAMTAVLTQRDANTWPGPPEELLWWWGGHAATYTENQPQVLICPSQALHF